MEEKDLLSWKEVGHAIEIRNGLRELTEGLRVKGNTAKYPRPHMTHEMASAGFALIICGPDEKQSARMAQMILESQDLKAFCKAFSAYGMTAQKQLRMMKTGYAWSIVLNYDVREKEAA